MTNKIYNYADFGQMPFTGGHCLFLVGYNDTLQTKDGRGAFRVINSWGIFLATVILPITYQMLAQKNYAGDFLTFDLRANYRPQLLVTLDLSNVTNLVEPNNLGIKINNGQVYSYDDVNMPFMWAFRDNVTTPFLNQVIIDLTDVVKGVQLTGKNTIFLKDHLLLLSQAPQPLPVLV